MAGSAHSYVAEDGDVIDAIVWRHYGRQDRGLVEKVLASNPGLAGRGPILEAGVRITLPPAEPVTERAVRLWG